MVQFITGTRNMGTEMFTVMIPSLGFVGIFIIAIPSSAAFVTFLFCFYIGINIVVKHRRRKIDGTWEWCRERQPHSFFNFDDPPDTRKLTKYDLEFFKKNKTGNYWK